VQADRPVVAAYFPAAQLPQLADDVDPTTAENVPKEQAVHADMLYALPDKV